MKILLYSQFFKILGGSDKVRGGLVSALENQKKTLDYLGIQYTENEKDSWDILQVNIPWPKAIRLAKKTKKAGKKVVMWSHVTIEDLEKSIIFLKISFLRNFVKRYLTKAFSIANLVLCPSEYTKNVLISYGLNPKKLVVQSNAVDVKKFYKDEKLREEYRKKYNLNGVVVGNVGLVIQRKGPDTFLMLAKKFTQNQFIWFGKIFSKVLVQRISLEALPNTRFTGFVDDILAGFNALDIFLFPSYEENQGMVILEAACVGLPILVRDIPVYNSWLIHNVNCIKAKNDEEFEKYLNQLLIDEDLRKRLSKEALILAQNESIEVQSQKLKREYDKLV